MAPEGDGNTAGAGDSGAGKGGSTDQGDQIDAAAAKAAMAVVDKMKAAGVEDPATVLDLVGKLRDFEKGTKLPKAIQKQIDDLTAKVKSAEDGKLSVEDKLTKELAELKESLSEATTKGRTRTAKAAVLSSATKAGAVYPDDIQNRADLLEKIEYDEDGNPTNVEELVTQLKKDRPALFNARAGTFDGGPRGGTRDPANMNDVLRERMGRR